MEMNYEKAVDELTEVDPEIFKLQYLYPNKPVVLKRFFARYPAFKRWSIQYFKETMGNLEVGVFHDAENKLDRSFKEPHFKMKFGDYLDEIVKGPTDKRLFLFNPFKHNPEMKNDFDYPEELTSSFIKKLPFIFFGGAQSVVRIHQDMDWSNVFLTQLYGRKKVILFAPEYSNYLYRYPLNVHSPVDIENPDYEKFPALRKVMGMQCILEPGDTLFMPSGYWHYIKYLDGGYAVNMRAINTRITPVFKGFMHIALYSNMDDALRKLLGQKWFYYKSTLAKYRAEKHIDKLDHSEVAR